MRLISDKSDKSVSLFIFFFGGLQIKGISRLRLWLRPLRSLKSVVLYFFKSFCDRGFHPYYFGHITSWKSRRKVRWNPLLKRYCFFIGVSPCVNRWQSIHKSRFWAWVKPPISKTFDFLHSHLFLAYTLIPFPLRYSFALTPLQTRCKSVSWNGRKMGFASNLVGSCMGGTTILYFQCKDTEIFFWTRKTRRFVEDPLTTGK